MDKSRRK